jgi:hypothetical protein
MIKKCLPQQRVTTKKLSRQLVWITIQRRQNKQGTVRNDINDIKKVVQIFEQQLENYFKFITSIDYVELIRNYLSKLYDAKTFKLDQGLIVKDTLYTARMFDVFGWGPHHGTNKFKYLELCAMIVFAKPIHNDFQ